MAVAGWNWRSFRSESGHQTIHPFELPGQTNAVQVVVLLGKGAGVGPQPLAFFGLVEQRAHLLGQSRVVKEVHQAPGLVVLDGLVQRLRVAGHNGAAEAYGFYEKCTRRLPAKSHIFSSEEWPEA